MVTPRCSQAWEAPALAPPGPLALTLLAESWVVLKVKRAPLLMSSSSHFPLNHLMVGFPGSSFPFTLATTTTSFPGAGEGGGE